MTFIRAHRVRELLKLTRRVSEARRKQQDVRAEVVGSLAQIVGASAGIFVQDNHFVRGGRGPLTAATALNAETLEPGVAAIIEDRTSMPLLGALVDRAERGKTIALARNECFSKRSWERTSFVDSLLRPVGFDDCLAAVKTGAHHGHVLGFNFLRERGDRPFSVEDRAVLELFTEHAAELIVAQPAANRWRLTQREKTVLEGIRRGDSNKEIAQDLSCSLRTIETHVGNILRKSKAPSRARLIVLAED